MRKVENVGNVMSIVNTQYSIPGEGSENDDVEELGDDGAPD